MMYGLNTVALTKIQQVELEGDGIRNEYISGTAQAEQLETKLERKKCGHVQRSKSGWSCQAVRKEEDLRRGSSM